MQFHRIALILISAMILSACGPQTPEERLEDAAQNVQEAKHDVAEASEDVAGAMDSLESRRTAVHKAETELADAKRNMRRLQRDLAKSQAEFENSVSERSIFRLVQTRLLNDPALQETAVYANVTDDSVFLYGDVATAAEKKRAAEIAGSVPGVSSVRNFIDIETAANDMP